MFNEVFRAITNNSQQFNSQKVLDCIVGVLDYDEKTKKFSINKNFSFFSEEDWTYDYNRNSGNIVVVLESPHKKEYNKEGKPLRPAMGTTGEKLKNIIDKLNNIDCFSNLTSGIYNLCLVNAVQYQCSFGISPIQTEMRNVVFRLLWKNLNIDFKTRIENINPVLIINLCTGGKKVLTQWKNGKTNSLEPALNVLVQDSINKSKLNQNIIKLYGVHPSSRNYEKSDFEKY